MLVIIGIIVFVVICAICSSSSSQNVDSNQEDKVDWWTIGMIADIMNKKNKE